MCPRQITGWEYRFVSPVAMVTKVGEVMAVKRVGLTRSLRPVVAHPARATTHPYEVRHGS